MNSENDAIAVENPAIAEIFDLRSGDYFRHDVLIGNDYEKAIQLRLELKTLIKRQTPRYVCSLCNTPVYLVSRSDKRRFFFRHTLEDGRCPALTRGDLSQDEIDAIKYNGAKESDQHLQMKEWVAQSLYADQRFTSIEKEKRWSGALTGEWRKPDVRAIFQGIPVVFEIQLSTTYVDVIAERREFYLNEGGMLLWIFRNFDAGERKLTQDDVFFNNNRNAFVVSQATCHSSVQNKKFHLECIWAEPTTTGVSSLNRRLVAFDEITLEQDKQRAYYFDFDSAKEEIKKQARQRELDRLLSLRERFETLWLSYWPAQKIEHKKWVALKKEFSLEGVADLPQYFSGLPHPIITALYSAKYGKPIVWGFKTFIEVAHQITGHKTYLHYFMRALAVATCKHPRPDLQTSRFSAQINCK